MPYPGHDLKFEQRTTGEERLFDHFWPASCAGASAEYFRESIDLLKTVKHHDIAVTARLRDYLTYVQDTTIRNEIETLIHSLEKKVTKAKKDGQKR